LPAKRGSSDIAAWVIHSLQRDQRETIQPTYYAADPIAWRQMHHWGLMKGLIQVKLRKGVQVLTLHTLRKGHMNFAYLDFKPKSG